MSGGICEKTFPVWGLVPKAESGVINFLKKYPNYDGTGTTIAIFDSGVDPKASALMHTPDGEVKVTHRFDGSGCGDVDTTKIVTANENDIIIGLSGRELKITEEMKSQNISKDKFRIGQKNLDDLYPRKLRERLQNEFRVKYWNDTHKLVVAGVSRQIDEFDRKNQNNQNNSQSFMDKLNKDNLDNTLEYLNNFDKKQLDEIKTFYDCVLYKTEEFWMVAIDVNESGDLKDALFLSEYSISHDAKSIGDMLTISMNVHEDGDCLELVGISSTHGTHVASIAAGYYPEDSSDLNGVAPGAKIVSISAADGRFETMETGTAIVRGIIKVMELCESGVQIDVINMSYGEFSHWSDTGRVTELMAELINKYGVVFVVSAGNQGPALSTIGTPPNVAQPCFIGVGAYFSSDMTEAEYSLREKIPANVYTWSSRDPCPDGGHAVTVCAPGAAIASVPEYTLLKQILMNGTSMAAPHVAGAVALLISGLKANNIEYSPYSIKRAIWNSATFLSNTDIFAQGNGLLTVDKTYEHLVKYSDAQETNIRFQIGVAPNNAKGIYIRRETLIKPEEFNVTIEPIYLDEKYADVKDKINFNIRLVLVCNESWIKFGSYLDLCYGPRTIVVKVDGTALNPGAYKSSIKAYDSSCIEKGTLFEIPVNVVVPLNLPDKTSNTFIIESQLYKSNTILRTFILVPKNVTWAVLKLKLLGKTDTLPGKFMVHTVQLLPQLYCKYMQSQKLLVIKPDMEILHGFKCEENVVLEICIAKFWSDYGEHQLSHDVEFHGIKATNASIMHAGMGIHRICLKSLLNVEVQPTIQLKTAVMLLKPSESKILTLSVRDVIPPGRQIYQNLLTYHLHLTKVQEIIFLVPMFNDILYESAFESQIWMIFDVNKKLVGCGDVHSHKDVIKLEKGDYVIKLQVRHERKDVLEKISDSTILAQFKLANPISLDITRTYNTVFYNGKKNLSFRLTAGIQEPIYVNPLTPDKLTKGGIPQHCSWLEGTLSYSKDELGRKYDSNVFKYYLTEGPPIKKSNGVQSKDDKNKLDEYNDGLRDYKCNMLSKLDLDMAEEIYKEILQTYPNHLNAHTALIGKLEPNEYKLQLPFTYKAHLNTITDIESTTNVLKRIVELSNIVIEQTDINGLLQYYGIKQDNRSDASKIKINMDKQKATLLDAYVKKMIALSKLRMIEMISIKIEGDSDDTEDDSGKGADDTSVSLDEFNNLYTDVGRFIDYADLKIILVTVWHAFLHQHYGRMLKCLTKLYEDKINKDILEEIYLVVNDNKNWQHISKALRRSIIATNPNGYRLF